VRLPKFSKKVMAIGAAAGITLGAAGIAAAYFTTTGTGTGHATVGSATAFTVTSGTYLGTLYPGTTTATVKFTIKNVGKGHQEVTKATPSVATKTTDIVTNTSGTKVTGCLAGWFAVSDGLASANLAPNGTTTDTVTVTMHTTSVTQNKCEGAVPRIHLHVTS